MWGAHEGSLLLWILILNIWTVAVAAFSRRLPDALMARVLGVLGFISFGFLLFTIATSNPFLRHIPALADGNDLNPILQDPGLIMHPPMLYTGYVGFSVAFAFAIAALLGGELDHRVGALGASVDERGVGDSSRSAFRSEAGGRITCSAGAAGGSGIRSRTRRSCRGWSARR